MVEKSNWKAILFVYLIGVVGAVQVGRIAPAANSLRNEMAIELATLGWIVSLITFAAALLGLVAGLWVVRRGPRFALLAGLTVLISSVLIATLSSSVTLLLVARVAEGLGFLAIVVAAPTLIAREASSKDIARSLALWSTYFPLGISTAAIAGGFMSEVFGWRVWFGANAGLLVTITIFAVFSIPQDQSIQRHPTVGGARLLTQLPRAAWLLGAGLLGLTLLTLALLSMLPVFLIETQSYSQSAAGSTTGFVALASILGSLVYGFAANKFSERAIILSAAAILLGSAFPAFNQGTIAHYAVSFASLAVFASGILVASTFAAVPRLIPDPDKIGPANGLIAQLGSVGALIGPPFIGYFVSLNGWTALSIMILVFTLSFIGFALSANATSRHS